MIVLLKLLVVMAVVSVLWSSERFRTKSREFDEAAYDSLQKIMRATIDDLDDVSGVGETRARAIKEGLSRLAETSILDRYN